MTANARLRDKVVLVTGASSGIGAATAAALGRLGCRLVLGARRIERLEAFGGQMGGEVLCLPLDVANEESCATFVRAALERHDKIDILVNNAGLARGFEHVVDNDEHDWREMIEANLMGLMRMTRACLPSLIQGGHGDIVHVGSIAGLQPYAKGAAYCASKAAVEAFVQALRLELVGTGVRQLVVEPGMVETEFSVVRFHGDSDRAAQVYAGVTPLSAEDVAECIVFALTRPAHVCVQTLLVTPTAQAAVSVLARNQ
jgi:3-hydroxy acid dehydrogenase / malonic semialdehyde reductase